MTVNAYLPIECNWRLDVGNLDERPVPPLAGWPTRYEQLGAAVALPPGAATAQTFLGGVPALMVAPAGHWADTTLLYFHGGWYGAGSSRSHQGGAAGLAARIGSRLILPDYRLADAGPFPAAVHDAMSAYLGLLDFGTGPEQIVVAGDGAGAGLAVALMLALRDSGLGLPAAAVLFAPWADLAGGPARLPGTAAREFAAAMAGQYAAGTDPAHPLISPVHADLAGLPPLQVQVAADGVLRQDADRLAATAAAAGVRCDLVHWPAQDRPTEDRPSRERPPGSAPAGVTPAGAVPSGVTPADLPGWPVSAPQAAAAFAHQYRTPAKPTERDPR
jgi:monoterpene epsilon-lactone hydrolase